LIILEGLLGVACVIALKRHPSSVALAIALVAAVLASAGLLVVSLLRGDKSQSLKATAACFLAIIPSYILSFATLYLTLAHDATRQAFVATGRNIVGPGDAMYFASTVFTTTGFGDISPITPAARWAVTAQMLSGILIVAVGLGVAVERSRD